MHTIKVEMIQGNYTTLQNIKQHELYYYDGYRTKKQQKIAQLTK